MKNDQYFKHDAGASCNQKIMRLIDDLGMKGYGAYWVLQETLRMQKNYRAPLSIVRRLARQARVMPAFLLRIINNYNLFVVEAGCFYSPGMLRRMRAYDTKTTPTLHQDAPLEGANSLEMSENTLPNARKEEKKERREEKKEKKKEEEEEILRQALNDSKESAERPISLRGERPDDGTTNLLRWVAHPGRCPATPRCLCRVGGGGKAVDEMKTKTQ